MKTNMKEKLQPNIFGGHLRILPRSNFNLFIEVLQFRDRVVMKLAKKNSRRVKCCIRFCKSESSSDDIS